MTKAELTAENRPACECCQPCAMKKGSGETHEDEGGVEIIVILLHVICIVLHRLPFVHSVEIELGVIVLDWWEVRSQGFADAIWSQLIDFMVGAGTPKRTIGGPR